jgi:uncharacterized protein (DUF2336 family)
VRKKPMNAMTSQAFTPGDIRALIRGPTEDERAAVAYRLCRKIDTELSESDRQAADEILRVMVADAAEIVRRALAVTLRASPFLPRDVALRLTADVEAIAAPVLSFSPVLSDADLVEIVAAAEPFRQAAIARRPEVSENVVDAIARFGDEEAVKVCAANEGAAFSDSAAVISLERFRESRGVATAFAFRKNVPAVIMEKLVSLVSAEVRRNLVERHPEAAKYAAQIVEGVQERATVDLLDQIENAKDVEGFVEHLYKSEKLTPSLLLRALAAGYLPFFEASMAKLAVLPRHRAWLLVHDAGKLGFKALYERAGMPQRLYPTFRTALDTFHEMDAEGLAYDRASFQSQLLERFLTQAPAMPKDDIDYLIDRLDALNGNRRAVAEVA